MIPFIILDVWADVKLAFVLLLFIIFIKWVIDKTGSKVLAIVIAVIFAYLTFYSHYELLIIAILFFFVLPSVIKLIEGYQTGSAPGIHYQ